MLPDPLHPAVVHFPIVLALLMPVLAGIVLWKTRGTEKPGRLWAWVVLCAALTALSTRIATGTGADQEERVEGVVSEEVIHDHEEKAESLLILASVTLLLGAAGLAPGKYGLAGRGITVAASLVLASQAVWVGKTGGELVYVHGAAGAYVDAASAVTDHRSNSDHDIRADRDDDD